MPLWGRSTCLWQVQVADMTLPRCFYWGVPNLPSCRDKLEDSVTTLRWKAHQIHILWLALLKMGWRNWKIPGLQHKIIGLFVMLVTAANVEDNTSKQQLQSQGLSLLCSTLKKALGALADFTVKSYIFRESSQQSYLKFRMFFFCFFFMRVNSS